MRGLDGTGGGGGIGTGGRRGRAGGSGDTRRNSQTNGGTGTGRQSGGAREVGGAGRQAENGRRGSGGGSAGDAAAGEPLDDDDLDADVDVEGSAATEEGSELGTGVEGQVKEATAGSADGKGTTEVDTEIVDDVGQEIGNITEEAADKVERNGNISLDGEGEPKKDDSLEFNAQRAVGAGEPDGELGADVKFHSGGEFTLGACLESKLDISTETSGEINAQEGGEGGLTANGQEARL